MRGKSKNDTTYWYSNSSGFDEKAQAIVVHSWNSRIPAGSKHVGFLSSSETSSSWEGNNKGFLGGDYPLHMAAALKQGILTKSSARAERTCAALQHDKTLEPGEAYTIHYALGIVDRPEEVAGLAKKITDSKWVESAFQEVIQHYAALINKNPIQTPEPILNTMLNIWSKVQLEHLIWSARKSAFYNWRNHLQDAQGFLSIDPSWAKEFIRGCCAAQKSDGFMRRCSERGLPLGIGILSQTHRDIAIWCIGTAADYISETGDRNFLDELVSFSDNGAEDTILNHLIKALRWLCCDLGEHGLSRFGDGDWNDAIEAGTKGKGESVWMSEALISALKLMAALLRDERKTKLAEEFFAFAEKLKKTINDFAYDGRWYIRGTTDTGKPFGKESDQEGRIFLLPLNPENPPEQSEIIPLWIPNYYHANAAGNGKVSLKVDGLKIDGNIVKSFCDRKEHSVEVEII